MPDSPRPQLDNSRWVTVNPIKTKKACLINLLVIVLLIVEGVKLLLGR